MPAAGYAGGLRAGNKIGNRNLGDRIQHAARILACAEDGPRCKVLHR
jgi:hypothetical protein